MCVCMCFSEMYFYCTIDLCLAYSNIHCKIAAYYLSVLCCPEGQPLDIAVQGAPVCRSEQCWPPYAAVATRVIPTPA